MFLFCVCFQSAKEVLGSVPEDRAAAAPGTPRVLFPRKLQPPLFPPKGGVEQAEATVVMVAAVVGEEDDEELCISVTVVVVGCTGLCW